MLLIAPVNKTKLRLRDMEGHKKFGLDDQRKRILQLVNNLVTNICSNSFVCPGRQSERLNSWLKTQFQPSHFSHARNSNLTVQKPPVTPLYP